MMLATIQWCQNKLIEDIKKLYADPERYVGRNLDAEEIGKRVKEKVGELKCLAGDLSLDYSETLTKFTEIEGREAVCEFIRLYDAN